MYVCMYIRVRHKFTKHEDNPIKKSEFNLISILLRVDERAKRNHRWL